MRICQATLTHFGLLAIGYFLFGVVACGSLVHDADKRRLARRFFTLLTVAALLLFGPLAHDPEEYDYPVLALLLAVAAPILLFSFVRMSKRESEQPSEEDKGKRRHRIVGGLQQLAGGFSIAVLIWYLATFSWSEHRENYFESAIVLGVEAAENDAPQNPQALAQPAITGFETSGSAVVGKQLLISDDELVGSVLLCPEAYVSTWNCGIAKVQRKRKQSQPYTEQPRLAAVQDLEGLASDGERVVFLVGSHEGKDGTRRSDREFLIRAEWDDEELELEWTWSYYELAKDFQRALKDAGGQFELTATKIHDDFNIEDLAYRPTETGMGVLYVGLRAPLTPDGRALILAYDFDPKKAPVDITPHVHLVDLAGLGVRGLDWDSQHDRLLIVAGASKDRDRGLAQAGLVAYDLERSDQKLLQGFAGYDGEPEAVSRTPSGRLLVLFDGKVATDRGGVYIAE